MKNLRTALLGLGLVAFCAAGSFAQAPFLGTTPFSLSGSTLSENTGVTAGWSDSFVEAKPGIHAPRLFAAWSPNGSSIKLAATADVFSDAINNGYGQGTLVWSTNGVWLGVSVPVRANRWLSADLQGWYFLPGNRHVEVAGRASGISNGTAFFGGAGGNLDIKTTWFAVDLEGCLHATSDHAFLAGVRYDYIQGTMSLPDSVSELVLTQVPGLRTKLDVNLNSIFPYVGFKSCVSSGQGSMTISMKGFPWVISIAEVHPKSGYFGELFLSYELRPSRDFTLSVFGKADIAHAVFEESSQIANIFNKDPSAPQNANTEQSLPVTWQQYLFGASASLNFGVSFL